MGCAHRWNVAVSRYMRFGLATYLTYLAYWRVGLFVSFLSKHYPSPSLTLSGKGEITVCMDLNNYLPATLIPLPSSRDTVSFKAKTWGARSRNIFLLGRINTNSIQLLVPRGRYREYWARICKPKSILRNLFRQPMQPGGPVRQIGLCWESIPGLPKRFKNTGTVECTVWTPRRQHWTSHFTSAWYLREMVFFGKNMHTLVLFYLSRGKTLAN
jgi:hypothetical protein